MAPVSRRLLAGAVATRLAGVTNATGYYGAIGRPLPGQTLVSNGGTVPDDPPTKSASDLRVKPYFVLFPGAGAPTEETDLGDCGVDLDMGFQVTAAAGDIEDLLALVDRIHNQLYRWAPAVTGHVVGPLRPSSGRDVPLLTDKAFTPNRLYVPLQYQSIATT